MGHVIPLIWKAWGRVGKSKHRRSCWSVPIAEEAEGGTNSTPNLLDARVSSISWIPTVVSSAPHACPSHSISLSHANAAPENYDQRQTYASVTTSKTKRSPKLSIMAQPLCVKGLVEYNHVKGPPEGQGSTNTSALPACKATPSWVDKSLRQSTTRTQERSKYFPSCHRKDLNAIQKRFVSFMEFVTQSGLKCIFGFHLLRD